MSCKAADQGKPHKLKPYPVWVCRSCALAAGWKPGKPGVSTIHAGVCDVCGEWEYVTEPRDYGYPRFKGHVKP